MNDKKQRILVAAAKLFVENGFHGTPTSMIVKEAGVAKGTLFNYFETKENLIKQIYLEDKKYVEKHILSGVKPDFTVKKKLKHLFLSYLDICIQYPYGYRFQKLFRSSSFYEKLTEEEKEVNGIDCHVILKEGQKLDILKSGDMDLQRIIVMNIFDSCVQYLLSLDKDNITDELLDEMFRYFWDCIRN
jgi:AcrR family transcriptional regulator